MCTSCDVMRTVGDVLNEVYKEQWERALAEKFPAVTSLVDSVEDD